MTTSLANHITTAGVTLNATLNSKGNANTVTTSFEYGLTTNYGTTVVGNPSSLTNPGDFFTNITGLTPGETYHFRARADGGASGTAIASDMTFSTWETSLTGKIAFSSSRNGNFEIYIMNADGTNQTRLTNSPGDDIVPSLSPRGNKIAFISGRNNKYYQIYIMDIDGSNQTAISTSTSDSMNPVWSPDGTKIAYHSGWGIWTMNADGSDQQQITSEPPSCNQPSWSPDGTKIAFISVGMIYTQLFVMNADGTNPVCLTNDTYHCNNPAWSPDGARIAYNGTPNGSEGTQIRIMNSDGTNPIKLTTNGTNYEPTWSPDSTKIAFTSTRDNNRHQIYIMNADGSNQIRLAPSSYLDEQPSWGLDNPPIITFISSPKTFTAGSSSSTITIQTQNASGDPINVISDTAINLTTSSSTGVFSISNTSWSNITSLTIPEGNNSASFYYKDTAAGTPVITASSPGMISGTQQEIIMPAPASQIRVETTANGSGNVVPAQNIIAGNSLTVYAASRDQYGNFISNSPGTWSLVNKTGNITNSDLVPGVDNKSAIFTGHLAGTANIHVASNGLDSTDSGIITVILGEATKFNVTGYSSDTSAGTSNRFTVNAQNDFGDASYIGTVHFTSTDPQAVLPEDYTFLIGDNGTHTFEATLKTAGSQSITSTDTITSEITGSQNSIIVSPASPFQVRVESSSNGSGILIPAQNLNSGSSLTIYSIAHDQYGNYVSYPSETTWSLDDKAGGIADSDLSATTGASAVFTGHQAGSCVINASVTGLTSVKSGVITVVVPPPVNTGGGGGGSGAIFYGQVVPRRLV